MCRRTRKVSVLMLYNGDSVAGATILALWFSWQLVTFYLFTVGQRYIEIDQLIFVTSSIFKQFIIYIKDKFQIFHFKSIFFGHFHKAQNALMTLKHVSLLLSQDSFTIFKWNTWKAQSIKIEIDSTFTERHSIWQDNQAKTSLAFVLEQRFNVLYERNPFFCSYQFFKNNTKYHPSSGFGTQSSWEIQLSYIHIYVCEYTHIYICSGETTGTGRHLRDNVEIQCSGNCLKPTRVTLVKTLRNGGHSI